MNELLNRRNRKDVKRTEEARLAKSATTANEAEPTVTTPDSPPMERYEFAGFPIVVENKKGSIRLWGDDPETGKSFGSLMHFDYGYIDGAVGADGDEVDVYVGPDPAAEWVYVVHQNEPESGKYDEDKVLLGFADAESARQASLKQYDDPRFFGGMSQMSLEDFRGKLANRETLKITNSVEKTASLAKIAPGSLAALSDEDFKQVANELAELWASLYGSALGSSAQAISSTHVAMSMEQVKALQERRKKDVISDEPLAESKVHIVTSDGKAYGLLSVGAARELSVNEFMRQESDAQLVDDEEHRKVLGANRLFSHPVLSFLDFGEPLDPAQVQYKTIFKMTRGEVISLAAELQQEALRRGLEVGLPPDLQEQAKVGKDGAHPQQPDLYMPPNDPAPDKEHLPSKPSEYRSNNQKIPGVPDPVDGPAAHEWGSNNPAQQEWDAGDYSRYGDGDAGGFYEFSLDGGARYISGGPATPPNAGTGTPPNAGEGPIESGALAAAGKRNPVIARWRTTLTKAAVRPTVRMLLEARVHEAFTVTADHMLAMGLVDREECIALSHLIGQALDQLGGEIPYDLGARPLDSVEAVELHVISKDADGSAHLSAKLPPDIIMEMPRSVTPGPAAQSPQWGPDTEHAKEAQFVVGEPPSNADKAVTEPDVRGGHFEEEHAAAGRDDFMVEQDGTKRYPFVLQHHFRGLWTPEERSELKAGLQKAKGLVARDRGAAVQALGEVWKKFKPCVLTSDLEKLMQAAQSAADSGGEVSTAVDKFLDGSAPKPEDLQRISGSIVNRGNVHTDLRVKSPGGDWLIGWTMDTPGPMLQTVEGKLLRVLRSKVLENQPGDRVLCQKKGRMGAGWLHVVGPGKSLFRVNPGEVGATKETAGEIRFVDKGEAVFGAQKPAYHEVFLFPEKSPKLSGRSEFRLVGEGDAAYWLFDHPQEQAPFAVTHDRAAEQRKADTEHVELLWNDGALAALKALGYGPAEKASRLVEVYKSAREERTVFGVVMEPEAVDAHGEIISAEEIRNAAYGYMEFYQQKGFQHGRNPKYPALPEGLRLLESWIVDPEFFPQGFMVGSRHIKPGTWLMKMRVDHDGLWEDIKNGLVTGFSIGGFARSLVEERAA